MPPPRRRAGVPPTPSPRLRRASARAARAWPGREGNARAPGHYSTTPAMPLPRGPRAARAAAGAWSLPPTPCTRRTAPCVRGAGGSLQYALYLPAVARVRRILRRVEAEHLPVVCERFLEGGCVPFGLRVGHPFADGIQLCDDRGIVLTAVES